MPYVVCKHPAIRIDIMVKAPYQEKLTAIVNQSGCTFEKQLSVEPVTGQKYVILRDIQCAYGYELGKLIGELYRLPEMMEDNSVGKDDKFYILVKPRRKEKKHVQGNRTETGAGSERRNKGESFSDIQPGEDSGSGDNSNRSGGARPDDPRQLEIFDLEGLNVDCDQ